jgi:hypothetical protein
MAITIKSKEPRNFPFTFANTQWFVIILMFLVFSHPKTAHRHCRNQEYQNPRRQGKNGVCSKQKTRI